MKYTLCTLLVITTLFFSCKKSNEINFSTLTTTYFNEKNKLNPLDATLNNQKGYEDQLTFEMTEKHKQAQLTFFDKFDKELQKIDKNNLSTE